MCNDKGLCRVQIVVSTMSCTNKTPPITIQVAGGFVSFLVGGWLASA